MAQATIKPGQTIALAQSFSFGGSVTIDGGTNGGQGGAIFLTNRDTLTAAAMIQIAGGPGSTSASGASQGGQLRVTGSLTNQGLISVGGGGAAGLYVSGTGGAGGTLSVSGAMTNAGTVTVAGGETGRSLIFPPGLGGVLSNTGVLVNTGLISVAGNFGGQYGAARSSSGTLDNLGTLTNIGTLALLQGSSSGVLLNVGLLANSGTVTISGASGSAATLSNSGVFTNTGLVEVQGGGAVFSLYGYSSGGDLVNTSNLSNDGTIDVQGGAGSVGLGAGVGGIIRVETGTLTNDRLITLDGGATGDYGYFGYYQGGGGGRLGISLGAHLENTGRIVAMSAPTYALGGTLSVGGFLSNYGQIGVYGAPESGSSGLLTIAVGGVLAMNTGSSVISSGDFGTAAAIVNSGVIQGRGVIDVASIYNQGAIEGFFGTLTVIGNITGAGFLEETATGTLVLQGTIASGQTLFVPSGVIVTGIGNAGVLVAPPNTGNGGKLRLTGGGAGTLNAADTRLTVQLDQASTLTLSQQAFVTVLGSTGADIISALASGQTLTGGLGADLLTGATATGDTFKDVAAGLNGDTIGGFAGSDVIDVTDLLPGAGLALSYTQGTGQGALTLSEGATSTTIILLGSFTNSQFTTASDGHGGVLIGLH